MIYSSRKELLKRMLTLLIPALIFGSVGTVIGYAVSGTFPGMETWRLDWQTETTVPVRVSPSIVLVPLEENGPASCGPGRWNATILAQTISALHEGQAKVIAPALHFEVPNAPECGDVTGQVKLIEATKQAGNVVYPSSVPGALAKEAKEVGFFKLEPDEDGIFRSLTPLLAQPDSDAFPFGVAISWASSDIWEPLPEKEGESFVLNWKMGGRVSFPGRWEDRPFTTYAFPEVWDLIQQRDPKKLAGLVEGKAVLLFPVGGKTETLPTPIESAAPLGFLHANLLNTQLTQTWWNPVSSWDSVKATLPMAVVISWLMLFIPGMWKWIGTGLIIPVFFGLNQIPFYTLGMSWPVFAPMLAFLIAAIGPGLWTVYQRRIRAARHFQDVTAQFAVLQEKLVGKESVVEQLEEELEQAKEVAHESTQMYEQVTVSAENNQARLDAAQTEVDSTRRRLQELQQELDGLQKAAPSSPIASTPLSDDNLDQLRKECESFEIVTRDARVLKIFQDLKKAAGTTSPILILGETGTGKELVAKAAHHLSPRARSPFVSVNMAAIRPELFESELFGSVKGAFTGAIGRRGFLESADHGTLFLDEIGELPLDLQAKLLRVLEDGTFYRVGQSSPTQIDVRIVAATNRDLALEVQEGRYREDFYYRLRSIVLRLPPLREREPEDLRLLAHQFMRELSPHGQETLQLSEGALEAIQTYSWPGNIRELRQIVAQAVALVEGAILTEEDLRLPALKQARAKQSFFEAESYEGDAKEEIARREDAMVLSFLRQNKFDMQATAKALNWDRSTVTQRLKGMGFQALVEHSGNVKAAAEALAGNPSLINLVELKLRGYHKNLLPSTKQYESEDHAIADCRKRFRNLPDRHFPSVEILIRQHFANSGR